MDESKYPRGVEVVVGVFIFGPDGRVALINSPKWDLALLPAGGHLEPGETIEECAVREAYEETGLKCEYVGILNIGQIHADGVTGYHRPAHMVYLHVLLKTSDTTLIAQAGEINSLAWYDPTATSTLSQLDPVGQDSLKKATAYLHGEHGLINVKS